MMGLTGLSTPSFRILRGDHSDQSNDRNGTGNQKRLPLNSPCRRAKAGSRAAEAAVARGAERGVG